MRPAVRCTGKRHTHKDTMQLNVILFPEIEKNVIFGNRISTPSRAVHQSNPNENAPAVRGMSPARPVHEISRKPVRHRAAQIAATVSAIFPACSSISATSRNCVRARTRLCVGYAVWKYVSPFK